MLTMAERNIRSPLLRTPRASLSTSRSGRSSHLVLARAKPSRVPLAEPLVAGDLDTALPGLEEGLGRLREVHFFPADLLEHGLGQGLVHEESPDEMGSGMEPLLPVPRGEGAVGGLVRTEVLGGLARHRTVQVGGADVVAGGAVQYGQGQAFARVGQRQVADGCGLGLDGAQRVGGENEGHGKLLGQMEQRHTPAGMTASRGWWNRHRRQDGARPRGAMRSGLAGSARKIPQRSLGTRTAGMVSTEADNSYRRASAGAGLQSSGNGMPGASSFPSHGSSRKQKTLPKERSKSVQKAQALATEASFPFSSKTRRTSAPASRGCAVQRSE